jgi:hypothetical protein
MEIAGINNIILYENKGIAFVFPNIANIDEVSSITNTGTVDNIDFCSDINFSRKLKKGLNDKQLKDDTIEFFIQDFSLEKQATVKRLQKNRCGYIAQISFESGEVLILQTPIFFNKTKKDVNKNSFVVSANYRVQSLEIDLSLVPLTPPEGSQVFWWYGAEVENPFSKIFDLNSLHTFSVLDGKLIIERTVLSGGAWGSVIIQGNLPFVADLPVKLYMKYNIISSSDTSVNTVIKSNLRQIGGSNEESTAKIEVNGALVAGEYSQVSLLAGVGNNGYSPKVEIDGTNNLFKIEILELYYL